MTTGRINQVNILHTKEDEKPSPSIIKQALQAWKLWELPAISNPQHHHLFSREPPSKTKTSTASTKIMGTTRNLQPTTPSSIQPRTPSTVKTSTASMKIMGTTRNLQPTTPSFTELGIFSSSLLYRKIKRDLHLNSPAETEQEANDRARRSILSVVVPSVCRIPPNVKFGSTEFDNNPTNSSTKCAATESSNHHTVRKPQTIGIPSQYLSRQVRQSVVKTPRNFHSAAPPFTAVQLRFRAKYPAQRRLHQCNYILMPRAQEHNLNVLLARPSFRETPKLQWRTFIKMSSTRVSRTT